MTILVIFFIFHDQIENHMDFCAQLFSYCYFGCLSSQSNDGSSFWVAFCEEKITAEEVIKATKSGSFELAYNLSGLIL